MACLGFGGQAGCGRLGRAEVGEGQGCLQSGTFQQQVLSLGPEKGHPPSAPPPAPRPMFREPRGRLPLLCPPPKPCPAFPVNTDTSSPERAWQCWGHTRLACEPSTQWLAQSSSWPLHTPGLPWDPEKCHLLLELDSQCSHAKGGQPEAGGGREGGLPQVAQHVCSITCRVKLLINAHFYTPAPLALTATR